LCGTANAAWPIVRFRTARESVLICGRSVEIGIRNRHNGPQAIDRGGRAKSYDLHVTKPERDFRNPFQPARESLIDRQIREAEEAGAFDNLPHRGERLPLVDDSAAGDWALAYRMLKGASFAPPWIETDKEVRALLAKRDEILARALRSSVIGRTRDEAELCKVVAAANDAIFRLNVEAPTARQHRQPLDLDAELAALAATHAEGAR
jgi:DnaJ family protein C protein 28